MINDSEFVSFTHETFGMHLGPGSYFMLDDGKEHSGLHVGPSGVTVCTYDRDDPFETLTATTTPWHKVDQVALNLKQGEVSQVGLLLSGRNCSFTVSTAPEARNLYRLLMAGIVTDKTHH